MYINIQNCVYLSFDRWATKIVICWRGPPTHSTNHFHSQMKAAEIITQAPVRINDFRGVRARYVKRTG